MERTHPVAHRRRLILFFAASAVAAFLLRDVLAALGMQVLAASVLMLLALPLCRYLEGRMSGSAAAALSLAALLLGMAALLLALVPMLLLIELRGRDRVQAWERAVGVFAIAFNLYGTLVFHLMDASI